MGIFVLILTAVLWYLYHKLFAVVYVNALSGIIRELAICFVLSLVIIATLMNILGLG